MYNNASGGQFGDMTGLLQQLFRNYSQSPLQQVSQQQPQQYSQPQPMGMQQANPQTQMPGTAPMGAPAQPARPMPMGGGKMGWSRFLQGRSTNKPWAIGSGTLGSVISPAGQKPMGGMPAMPPQTGHYNPKFQPGGPQMTPGWVNPSLGGGATASPQTPYQAAPGPGGLGGGMPMRHQMFTDEDAARLRARMIADPTIPRKPGFSGGNTTMFAGGSPYFNEATGQLYNQQTGQWETPVRGDGPGKSYAQASPRY